MKPVLSYANESSPLRELQRVLLHFVAAKQSVRLLSIKGEVAERLALRAERPKGDLDVWCDPARFDDYIEALRAAGWLAAPRTEASKALATHATTLLHEAWPFTADIHRTFPGFVRDPQQTFEDLWEGRACMRFAGSECAVPSVNACVLIAFVNGVRSAEAGGSAWNEAQNLSEKIRSDWMPLERAALASIAHQFGVDASSRDLVLSAVGPVAMGALGTPNVQRSTLNAWRMEVSYGHSATAQAVRAFYTTPLRSWPRTLHTLLFAPRSQFLADHPDAPSGPCLLAYRGRRALSAAIALPGLLWSLGPGARRSGATKGVSRGETS